MQFEHVQDIIQPKGIHRLANMIHCTRFVYIINKREKIVFGCGRNSYISYIFFKRNVKNKTQTYEILMLYDIGWAWLTFLHFCTYTNRHEHFHCLLHLTALFLWLVFRYSWNCSSYLCDTILHNNHFFI